jgi:hypothetical protein
MLRCRLHTDTKIALLQLGLNKDIINVITSHAQNPYSKYPMDIVIMSVNANSRIKHTFNTVVRQQSVQWSLARTEFRETCTRYSGYNNGFGNEYTNNLYRFNPGLFDSMFTNQMGKFDKPTWKDCNDTTKDRTLIWY